ncbi:hypothetical protein [Methylocystis sp. B8]|uniref:hypothetical protein n=1 Tax=Methylocystis sp. B8 TaxID=544938 RepID=UPI0010FCE981|nr:hypothetical protein [Methylocystis sp. B8]TLG71423.1 hypothetical protein FEV16_15985 [Methylocystis sp. B8]
MRFVNRFRVAHGLAADLGPAGGGLAIDRRKRQRPAVVASIVRFGDGKTTQRGRQPVECFALKSGAE